MSSSGQSPKWSIELKIEEHALAVNSDFYLMRAEQCAREANETRLANVRDRCLRSEVAWRKMAERTLEIETGKEQQEIDKARKKEAFTA